MALGRIVGIGAVVAFAGIVYCNEVLLPNHVEKQRQRQEAARSAVEEIVKKEPEEVTRPASRDTVYVIGKGGSLEAVSGVLQKNGFDYVIVDSLDKWNPNLIPGEIYGPGTQVKFKVQNK